MRSIIIAAFCAALALITTRSEAQHRGRPPARPAPAATACARLAALEGAADTATLTQAREEALTHLGTRDEFNTEAAECLLRVATEFISQGQSAEAERLLARFTALLPGDDRGRCYAALARSYSLERVAAARSAARPADCGPMGLQNTLQELAVRCLPLDDERVRDMAAVCVTSLALHCEDHGDLTATLASLARPDCGPVQCGYARERDLVRTNSDMPWGLSGARLVIAAEALLSHMPSGAERTNFAPQVRVYADRLRVFLSEAAARHVDPVSYPVTSAGNALLQLDGLSTAMSPGAIGTLLRDVVALGDAGMLTPRVRDAITHANFAALDGAALGDADRALVARATEHLRSDAGHDPRVALALFRLEDATAQVPGDVCATARNALGVLTRFQASPGIRSIQPEHWRGAVQRLAARGRTAALQCSTGAVMRDVFESILDQNGGDEGAPREEVTFTGGEQMASAVRPPHRRRPHGGRRH